MAVAAVPKTWLQLIDKKNLINWSGGNQPPGTAEDEVSRAKKILGVARILRGMDGFTFAGIDSHNLKDRDGGNKDTDDHKTPLRSWAVNSQIDVYARFETGVLNISQQYDVNDMDLVLGVYTGLLDVKPHVAFAGSALRALSLREYGTRVNNRNPATGPTWGVDLLDAVVDYFQGSGTPGDGSGASNSVAANFIYPDAVRSQWVDLFVKFLLANSMNQQPVKLNGIVQLQATITYI